MHHDPVLTTDTPDHSLLDDEMPLAFDQNRQQCARALAEQHRRLMVLELVLSAVLAIGFLVTGASRAYKDLLVAAGITGPAALVAVYVTLLYIAYTVLTGPLSWYGGFVLPHRFGLSTQTARGWLSDDAKGLVLSLLLGVPTAEVIYWLLRTYPDTWWLLSGLFLIVLVVGMGHLAPVLIVPLFYKLVPLKDPELVQRIERLAARAGTQIAGVYTINLSSRTKAANAMVMGLGSTKRIALGDTLYAEYSPQEIETIIAHELGHQVHHDLELGVVVQSILLLGGLYLAHLFLQVGVSRFGFDGLGDIAALPLVLLAIGIFSLLTMPLINGYSRWRERMADRFAVDVTHNPLAFARAMVRLANQNLAEADPPRWVVWLLYSHPPIKERVRLE